MKLLITIILITSSLSIRVRFNVNNTLNNSTNITLSNNTKTNTTLSRTNQFAEIIETNPQIEVIQTSSMVNNEVPSNKGYPQSIYPANHLFPIRPGDRILPRIIEKEPVDVDVIHKATVITPHLIGPIPVQEIPPNQGIVNINNNRTIQINNAIPESNNNEGIKENKGNIFSIETEKNVKDYSKRIVLKKNYYGIKPKNLSK